MLRRVPEFGKLHKTDVGADRFRRLERFDRQQGTATADGPIFDWRYRGYARAQSRVGVVQIPGLTVEILPKTDAAPTESAAPSEHAQGNLLTMLAIAGDVPLSERGLASLKTRRLPLLEALVSIFVERLMRELARGPDRSYVREDDNLGVVRGQIVLPEQIRRNAVLKHKVFCRFDEFSEDTWLNRVLKAAVRRLLLRCREAHTRRSLKLILEQLDGVSDGHVSLESFERIVFHRNNDRYRPLVNFARMVLLGDAPTPATGPHESFSILFPMERLFERFVARSLQLDAKQLGLARGGVHPQGRRRARWLLKRESDGRNVFRLRPDVVIDAHGNFPGLIVDTKWKRLVPDNQDSRNGVSQADLYQMAAYAQAYQTPSTMLLYPAIEGVTNKVYRLPSTDQLIVVAQLPLNYDLSVHRSRLANDLKALLWANAGDAAAVA